jgi:hypothetical protein
VTEFVAPDEVLPDAEQEPDEPDDTDKADRHSFGEPPSALTHSTANQAGPSSRRSVVERLQPPTQQVVKLPDVAVEPPEGHGIDGTER